jgi:capsular polysaccharide biosynthesis protein
VTLQDFLRALRHGWLIVVLCVVGGGLAGFGYASVQDPQYRATATLFISTTGAQTPDIRQTDNVFSQSRASTYAQLATTTPVLQEAANVLGDRSLSDVRTGIVSAAREETNLIDVTAVAPSADQAASEADAVAQALARTVNELEATSPLNATDVVLRLVQPASPPDAPESPRQARTVLVGLIVGLSAGVGITILRQSLSSRLRSPRDVAAVAGIVPTSLPEGPDGQRKGASPERRREAYRSLRSNLRYGLGARGSVAVAPVTPGSSARPLAQELARAFGEVGTSVLLIDADLRPGRSRNPRRSRHGESPPGPGLSEVLTGQLALQDAVTPGEDANTWLLSAGDFSEATSQLLSTEAMAQLLDFAATAYEYVLVVAPPMLERSEAAVLAAQAHACVLRIEARSTRRSDLLFALERVAAVGVTSVSLVLDKVSRLDMQPARVRYTPPPTTTPPTEPDPEPVALTPAAP